MEEPAGPRTESTEVMQKGEISPLQEPSTQSDTSSVQSPVVTPKKRRKMAIFITMGFAFILLVSCATYATLQLMRNKIDNNPTADAKNTSQVQTANPDTARDSAITQSLNDIDTGVATANTDQTSADSAVSDSNQQIMVPTE